MNDLRCALGSLHNNPFYSLELTTIGDSHSLRGLSGLGTDRLNSLHHVQTLSDFSENNVLSIKPRGGDSANEELRSVGVGSRVGHGQNSSPVVLVDEVLIRKLSAVDRLATSTGGVSEISTLEHELRDHAVEN